MAIHSKHTLLPDTLIGSAGMDVTRCIPSSPSWHALLLHVTATKLSCAEYPLNCIVSGEQLRIPITDKSGDGAGEVTMYVDTGGYQGVWCVAPAL